MSQAMAENARLIKFEEQMECRPQEKSRGRGTPESRSRSQAKEAEGAQTPGG